MELKPPGADERARGALFVLIGAAVAGVALAISIATFTNAQEEGGRYFVLYGPIILGLILLVNGLTKLYRSRGESKPGWQLDPTGRHHRRFWDGQRWTDHVEDLGQAALDPIGGGEQPASTTATFSP